MFVKTIDLHVIFFILKSLVLVTCSMNIDKLEAFPLFNFWKSFI